MNRPDGSASPPLRRSFTILLVILVAVAVFILTMVSIRKSRSDSLRLLEEQGRAFTEALALACENTITASGFFDRLVEEHYADLASILNDDPLDDIDSERLLRFVQSFNLIGASVMTLDSQLVSGAGMRSVWATPPEWVLDEARRLIAEPEQRFLLLVDQEELTGETIHYYIGLTSRLDRVVILATFARYHTEAYRQTGIGFLVQNMALGQGVRYILYQSTDGIIFSSIRPGEILSIESDPFLTEALHADTVSSRLYGFQGTEVLELARPFATEQYPIGLFRVGLSLEGYNTISRGFDQRMVVLAVILFGFLLASILYMNSRRRGRELSRIKSLTDTLFDEMRTGVAAVNRDGRILFANEAFVALLRTPDPVGRDWSDVVVDSSVAAEPFFTGRADTDETEISVADGEKTRTLLLARSRVNLPGRTKSETMVVVVYDVTRLKQYEYQVARRERLSELGNLAAGVAHEIRNPLNTISIAAQRLAAEFTPTEDADEFKQFTQSIRSETRRLNDIITRFLALAREEKRKTDKVRLEAVIEETVALLRSEAERQRIDIQFDSRESATVLADPDLLKQIVLNLFNNTKEALVGEPGVFRLTVVAETERVVVRVEDSGPGVPEALREKVLTPYFTTKEAGTGLGLPTVHKIMLDLGGDLRVESSELGGAAIVLSFPALTA